MRAGTLDDGLHIDGVLDETAWATAQPVDGFTQTEPEENAAPSYRTTVQVLAGPRAIVIGVICFESDPSEIVSFSVRRDAPL